MQVGRVRETSCLEECEKSRVLGCRRVGKLRLKGPKFLGHCKYKKGQNGAVGTKSKGRGFQV